ncbi:MAG: hypothetical protein JNN15_05490, partial [Blastocatellia bacterium]|nr:hypothetical protein [Blastocatellia bacterium]
VIFLVLLNVVVGYGATTTIRVHHDVGYGNSIYIRGNQAPLSWSVGRLATWTAGNIWVYQTDQLTGSFEFKALINDTTWAPGANTVATAGQTIDVWPWGGAPSDTTPPTVTISSPTANANISATIDITANAADNIGVSKVEFFVAGTLIGTDTTAPFSASWNSTAVSNGAKAITAKAYDAAGNSTTSAAVNVSVNNTVVTKTVHYYRTDWSAVNIHYNNGAGWTAVPGTPATSEGAGWWVKTGIVMSGTTNLDFVFNNNAGTWDNNNNANYKSTLSELWVKNGVIYSSNPTVADTTAPTVSLSAPATGATLSNTVNISANASDNVAVARVEFFANGSLIGSSSASPYSIAWNSRSVTNGSFSLTAKAFDEAGNSKTSTSVNVTVSNTVVSGNDFREETIYFLLTTRFFDGDPNNNFYNRDRIKIGDPHWRGDFKGLIQQLDYIKDLGFTAIWITPVVENRSGLDYHGYHAYDFTKVDPRLESSGATFQDLINAAHAKGLKIVLDIVINHSSNYGIRNKVWIDRLPHKYFRKSGVVFTPPYTNHLGNYDTSRFPFYEDNDNPVAPLWFRERQTSDPLGTAPLIDPKTGQTVGLNYDPNRFFGTDVNNLNPTWYHQSGFMAGGDWENPTALQQKHMAGDTMDLNTEHPVVKEYLINAFNRYIDMGVDALRIDTVKHVERGNLLEYVNAFKARKPNLFVFGENLVKGTGWGDLGGDNGPSSIRPWWYTRLTNDPRNPNAGGDSGFSVLDFSLFSTFRDNISRGSFSGIGGIFAMDWVYGDATKLVTFLDNHDVGPDNDFKYRYNGESWMLAASLNLLWTVRGIPCLYYGTEIQFMRGAKADIDGATDTIDTTGRAYFGDRLLPENITATKNHEMFKHIQRLNLIRKTVPALQKAPMSHVNEFGSGIQFVRDYNNGESYAVVGLTMGGSQTFTVSGVRNGTYKDAVTGRTVTVTNGSITFTVAGSSAGIYVLNGPGKIGIDGAFLR